ncbi:MAG TPA: tetratricopeptide repeat protein [Thermoanaerobaculia bacterium]|jgi:tetratricopeptide (TPR) repeat protein|nr:tetratricopeptide repeat protein [Thermoanaerobaculia bacterium]
MSRDNIVYATCGLLLGLVIGSFLLGPKLARSKLAGPDQISSSSSSTSAASAAPESAAMPAAPAGGAAGSPMEQVRQQLEMLKKQIEQNPNDFDALVQLGNMYMDVSKFPQAIDYFNRALAVREEPSVRTDLGICYKQSGQMQQARDAFRKVATEQPDQWQAIYNLAIVDGEMKDYTDARVQLAKLKQLRPDDPQVAKLEQALAAVK